MNPRLILRGLLLILSLLLIGYAFEYLHVDRYFSEAWIDSSVRGHGWHGEVMFLAVAALFTSLGMPRQMTSFLAGYGFGFALGSLLGLIATLFACVLTFGYARLLGGDLLRARFGARARGLESFIIDHTFTMTILLRLLPAGSNLLINIIAGVSRTRPAPFFAGSAIGYIPQTVIFALIGSGISVDPELRIVLGVVLFIASGMLGVHLYRKHRHGKHLGKGIDAALDDNEAPAEARTGSGS